MRVPLTAQLEYVPSVARPNADAVTERVDVEVVVKVIAISAP